MNGVIILLQIETEMQPRSGSYIVQIGSAQFLSPLLPLLTEAFLIQPLLGNVNPSIEQDKYLYEIARNVLLGSRNSEADLSDFECDILTLKTVLFLRDWNDDDGTEDDGDNTAFWEYTCCQYAIKHCSIAYNLFKNATSRCLKRHNRLYAKGGKKYYTTLLAHAMAPKSKFHFLFEQIFSFYRDILKYQFIESDRAFSDFSFALKKRFDGEIKTDEKDIRIKSLQSSSAIKLLFRTCPCYMSLFVENTVKNIDLLVSTEYFSETTYIASMLKTWYEKRSRDLRIQDRKERSKAHYDSDIVVTDNNRIKLSYQLINNMVMLTVPRIRLGEKLNALPEISIFLDNRRVHREGLRFFGNDFCITSNKKEIAVDDLECSDSNRINLKVVISNGGKEFYSTEEKLFRKAIVFDESGAEKTKQPEYGDIFYLYATASSVIDERIEDSPQCNALPSKAQLYRVIMGNDTQIIVNGVNLFPTIVTTSDLRIEKTTIEVAYVSYIFEQQDYAIYREPPTFMIKCPGKQYRVSIDGQQKPLSIYYDLSTESYNITLPGNDDVHEVLIIDNATNKIAYPFRYVVFKSFKIHFNGYHSLCDGESGSVSIFDNNGEKEYQYKIATDEQKMLLSYRFGELYIDVPVLRCRLNGVEISKDSLQTVWYKDIDRAALLEIESPRGYTVSIQIGLNEYNSSSIEIGNIVSNFKNLHCIEPVFIIIYKNGIVIKKIQLFDIVFKPSFLTTPLVINGMSLEWHTEDNFVGDSKEFTLNLYRKGNKTACYSLGHKNEIIEACFQSDDCVYDYTITVQETGFFSAGEIEIYRGKLHVGSPAVFRFDEKAIVVTDAVTDNEIYDLKASSGIITELKYIGDLPLKEKEQPYPCYEGCLQYFSNGKLYPYSHNKYESVGIIHEQINPVKIFIINDNAIFLLKNDGSKLSVNKSWKSITDRLPNKRNKFVYDMPNYYLFKVIEYVHKEGDTNHV